MYIVLAYDRKEGKVVNLWWWHGLPENRLASLSFAYDKERLTCKSDPNLEIVRFSCNSLEDLKATHARYFRSIEELVGDLKATLNESNKP